MNLLEISGLQKTFYDAGGSAAAHISVPKLVLAPGEMLILEGPSGSGKTTLLHLISGLLKEDEGEIIFGGVSVTGLTAKERDRWRAANIGYIFQKLNLLEALTVEENIILAAKWKAGRQRDEDPRQAAIALLEHMGLGNKAKARPSKLSLGEQQRVAILRAVFNRPPLLLADEPTASLDRGNADIVLALLKELCGRYGAALLLSTHDDYVKAQFGRRYDIRTGRYAE